MVSETTIKKLFSFYTAFIILMKNLLHLPLIILLKLHLIKSHIILINLIKIHFQTKMEKDYIPNEKYSDEYLDSL